MLRSALALLLLSAAAPALAQGIEVRDAYAITSLPGAPTGAAFMILANPGAEPDRLLSAASPAAERVEIHTHLMEDGIARMAQVEEPVEIPAGGEVALERGGLHVMFLGLTDPWEDGETVPLTLVFETAGEVALEVPVDLSRLGGEAQGSGGMGHGHGAMGEGASGQGVMGHGAAQGQGG